VPDESESHRSLWKGRAKAGDALGVATIESDGHYAFVGGAVVDTLKGGALWDSFDLSHGGADVVTGAGGGDSFTVLTGAHDTFVYAAVSNSTGASHDTITNADFDNDLFKVSTISAVTGVDAAVTTGALNAATFDANLASAVGTGQLTGHHALLFTADSGDLSGHTFLVIDENGTAGYQANADLVIEIVNGTGTLVASDFL